jgi:hypothetical protein
MPGPLDGLKRGGPSNMVEQELADLFNQKLNQGRGSVPPPAPGFRQDTLTPPHVGPFADEESPWAFLFRVVPGLRGIAPSIQVGPADGAVRSLLKSGYDPSDYGKVNLLGTTEIKDNRISLNPSISGKPEGNFRFSDPDRLRREFNTTTAHELYHAAGHPDEDREMSNIEGLMTMAREYQRRPR